MHLNLQGMELNMLSATQAGASQEGGGSREKNNREEQGEWKDETRAHCFRKYMLLSMLELVLDLTD